MAYDKAWIYTAATAAERSAYANTRRLKTVNGTVYLSFPMRLVAKNGIHVSPNMREEIKASRDDNTRDLIRVTASGTKTQISIDMLGGLNNAQKNEALAWFTSHETDELKRNINLLYYDPDSDSYMTGSFYRANPKYDVIYTTDTDIIWDAFTIELVQN